MDDEQKAAILAEARRNIASLHEGNLQLLAEDEPRQVSLPPIEVEDRAARWARFHAERELDRRRARAQLRRKEEKMANAPTPAPAGPSEDELLAALGEALGIAREQIRKELRAEHAAELAGLKNEIAELRGQVGVLLNLLSGSKGDVVALPRRA